jgi:alpha-tubulin suppressor-like RCC1 family protein
MMFSKINNGFMLPIVMVLSIAILAVISTLLMITSSSYEGGYADHYQKLADEAAEAGSAYATACLTLSSHVQTWGADALPSGKPNLTPSTDCAGTANAYPANKYVYEDDMVKTRFDVGKLDDGSSQFSAQISSQGYADVYRSNGTIMKTYSSTQKKVITWPTDVTAQKSASGTNRTCAIVTYNVYCWGFNRYGQLGNGMYIGGNTSDIGTASSIDSNVPVKVVREAGVMGSKYMTKLFVAQYHSCALSTDGSMYCWGFGRSGQLGNGAASDSAVPVKVGGPLAGKVITDIGGTNNSSCAIAEGKIYCWGSNSTGQAGINSSNTSTAITSPTLVTAGNTTATLPTSYVATALSTSGSRGSEMCAIANGKAYCWGQNGAGSIGIGGSTTTTTNVLLPTKVYDAGVLNGKTVTSISVDGYQTSDTSAPNPSDGYPHVCAVANGPDAVGVLYCWGENNYGQLGNDSTTDSSVPVPVKANGVLLNKSIQEVKVGLRHSCARANNGVYCWGLNGNGQAGDGSTDLRIDVPVIVKQEVGKLSDTNVVGIGAGANRGCAVITDGRTFCWGVNDTGQIGDGTTINPRRTPTESLFLRPQGNQYIF